MGQFLTEWLLSKLQLWNCLHKRVKTFKHWLSASPSQNEDTRVGNCMNEKNRWNLWAKGSIFCLTQHHFNHPCLYFQPYHQTSRCRGYTREVRPAWKEVKRKQRNQPLQKNRTRQIQQLRLKLLMVIGWWYYFPLVFIVKTPLPLLLVLGAAFISTIRGI